MKSNYFASNLKHLRSKRGLEQKDISDMLGLKSSTSVTNWEKGTNMARSGHLNDLANFFGIGMDDLINEDLTNQQETITTKINDLLAQLNDDNKNKVLDFTKVQLNKQNNFNVISEDNNKFIVYGRKSAAGSMIEVDDSLAKQDVLPYSMVPSGADELVEITGNSMEPLIKKGTEVFLRYQPSVENGEVAIVRIENEGVTCKRFYLDQVAKTITLKSENSDYEDMHFDPSQVTVLGKVLL